MEIDELKSVWNEASTPDKTNEEIKLMLSENRHPVLKGIRRQAAIEIAGWSVFLVCAYSVFDGVNKPLWVNILLALSVVWAILHNLMAYRFAKYLVKGNNIKTSLLNYLSNVKLYARISVTSRVLFAAGLLLFFTYNIHFNTSKYCSLAFIVLIFAAQVRLLYRLWHQRLVKLNKAVLGFSS